MSDTNDDRGSEVPPGGEQPPKSKEGPEFEEWERKRKRRRRGHHRSHRKERVLHTRVSERLSEDIRRVADDLRVPVSNLVRNALEEAFGAVERVSDEVGDLLDEVLGDAEGIEEEMRRIGRRYRRRHGRKQRDERDEEPAFATEGETAEDVEEVEARPASPPPAEAPVAGPAPEAGAGATMPFPEVLGWQSLLVNASQRCACDERELASGERAFVGLTERGLSRTFLCRECMAARSPAE
jgi:hypothetical protein